MFNAPLRAALVTASALAVTAGCHTRTRVTEQWRDPSSAAGPMHKIAVVGPNLPSKTKRDIEDRVAADFSSRGVNADPSYKVLGDAVPDTATARATLASHGYDGALVLSVTPVEAKVKQAPPDNFYAVPYGTPYMTQTYDWRRLVTEQYADVESNLWDLRGGKAVWGSKTRLENFTGNDFAKRVSRNVVPAVTDKGFVAR